MECLLCHTKVSTDACVFNMCLPFIEPAVNTAVTLAMFLHIIMSNMSLPLTGHVSTAVALTKFLHTLCIQQHGQVTFDRIEYLKTQLSHKGF